MNYRMRMWCNWSRGSKRIKTHTPALSIHSFIRRFIDSLNDSSIHSFVQTTQPYILSFVHRFLCPSVRLFVCSFLCSFVRPFVHLFIFIFILNIFSQRIQQTKGMLSKAFHLERSERTTELVSRGKNPILSSRVSSFAELNRQPSLVAELDEKTTTTLWKISKEILVTEKTYINALTTLEKDYYVPLKSLIGSEKQILDVEGLDDIFGNLMSLHALQEDFFESYRELLNEQIKRENIPLIGSFMANWAKQVIFSLTFPNTPNPNRSWTQPLVGGHWTRVQHFRKDLWTSCDATRLKDENEKHSSGLSYLSRRR